jgi:glycosyltransferase involved in cell wall biosynthesis
MSLVMDRYPLIISVVMPVYNESILAQTHADFEFIITNDDSMDASLFIALAL